jgi:hypothetical protein
MAHEISLLLATIGVALLLWGFIGLVYFLFFSPQEDVDMTERYSSSLLRSKQAQHWITPDEWYEGEKQEPMVINQYPDASGNVVQYPEGFEGYLYGNPVYSNQDWQCGYCNSRNPQNKYSCSQCGAQHDA